MNAERFHLLLASAGAHGERAAPRHVRCTPCIDIVMQGVHDGIGQGGTP